MNAVWVAILICVSCTQEEQWAVSGLREFGQRELTFATRTKCDQWAKGFLPEVDAVWYRCVKAEKEK